MLDPRSSIAIFILKSEEASLREEELRRDEASRIEKKNNENVALDNIEDSDHGVANFLNDLFISTDFRLRVFIFSDLSKCLINFYNKVDDVSSLRQFLC